MKRPVIFSSGILRNDSNQLPALGIALSKEMWKGWYEFLLHIVNINACCNSATTLKVTCNLWNLYVVIPCNLNLPFQIIAALTIVLQIPIFDQTHTLLKIATKSNFRWLRYHLEIIIEFTIKNRIKLLKCDL